MDDRILEFDQVSFRYQEARERIFEDLSFSVEKGEFTSLIGASGSGKSTIFRLINGFEQPEKGRILIEGRDIRSERAKCGYMPQHDLLFPWARVLENVALPLKVRKVPKKERLQTARSLLERVGLGNDGDKYPKELSGGMKQRAAFARTLAAGSDLLLLDEPFSALDSITRVAMQEWILDQWGSMDQTILLVTHDVEEAIFLSRKILVLTGHPVRSLIQVEVPLPEVRTREMLVDGKIIRLKEQLLSLLREESLSGKEDRGH